MATQCKVEVAYVLSGTVEDVDPAVIIALRMRILNEFILRGAD